MYSLRDHHQTVFREILCCGFQEQSVNKIELSLKSDKNIGPFSLRSKYVVLLPAMKILCKGIFVHHSLCLLCSQLSFLTECVTLLLTKLNFTSYNDQRNAQVFNLFIYEYLLLPYMFRALF
jgi:hypothetical protein